MALIATNTSLQTGFFRQTTALKWKRDVTCEWFAQKDAFEIATNNPSELMIIVPQLASGQYLLEITTQFTNGALLLKEPRTMVFESVLTVA